MDRALYVGMTGALQTLQAQAANSHNLANASTVGFKAQLVEARAAAVQGEGFDSRVNVQLVDGGWDARSGTVMQTGRDLDIALRDGVWLAVQTADGGEAYTRAGDLQLDAYGRLLTGSERPVMGEGGPLSIPPSSSIRIAPDGTVSVVPQGQGPQAQATVGRLKLIEARPDQLVRGGDGLFRARGEQAPNPAAGASLASGALESSNVNLADTMVTMIALARQFELHTQLMKSADQNAQAASSLLRLG